MSETATLLLSLLLGGGGAGAIFKYMQVSAENSILARQAKDTIAAKDAQIAELQKERDECDVLLRQCYTTRDQAIAALAAKTAEKQASS